MLSKLLKNIPKVANFTNKNALSKPFGLKFTKRTIIAPQQDPFIPYTREEIRHMRENPNYEQELKQSKIKEKEKIHKNLHFKNYANDSNPENHLTLDIQFDDSYDPIVDEITSLTQDHPFTVFHTPKKPLPNITGTYGGIKGSVKKLKPTVKKILGIHLYDAMAEMQESQKRSSVSIFRALNMVRNHAINVGMEQDHLWVKEAKLEKQARKRYVYYHARGKGGMMKRDWTRVKITLEEKPVNEIYKLMIGGNAPKGLAKIWRDKIYEGNGDLDVIRKFQFLLTSKGRQQRREIIKRKTHLLQNQFLVYFFLIII